MNTDTEEERKMLLLAAYAIDTYGAVAGVIKYNTTVADLHAAKVKTLTVLKAEIISASGT